MDIADVFRLMEQDLRRVESQFEENLRSDVSLIPTVGRYVLDGGGKRIRPLLLLLCARLCGCQGDRPIPLASIVEFIHTATLLHDDVVDGANLRRGRTSANVVWGNEASVLVGDFLFTKSFSLIVADGDLRILKAMSDATTAMAEGEVLELLQTRDLNTTESACLEVLEKKTAGLIAAACEIGALLGEASDTQVRALRDYGLDIGVAFQIMDDCLDYLGTRDEFGKKVGSDLGEGKITLPLIQTLRLCMAAEKDFVGSVVAKGSIQPGDLERVLELVRKYGGFEFAKGRAVRRVEAAKARLDVFGLTPEREALTAVADYVISRTR